MNSPPTRRAPVPERDWTRAILSPWMAGEEAPKTRLPTSLPYSGNPGMGAYSTLSAAPKGKGKNTFIEMF